MSDNVFVDQGDYNGQEAAILLLAAAEELDLPPGVVSVDTTGSSGSRFQAPADVVKKAGLKPEKDQAEEVPDQLDGPTPEFFANADKGDPKPEQSVATDPRLGASPDPLGHPDPAADGQAGESQASQRAESLRQETSKKATAKKAVPAKKAAAKSTAKNK